MIGYFLRRRRRRQLVARPFPASWAAILDANVARYRTLDPAERERLHGLISIFVAETAWEGCAGLEIDDEIKLTIAAQACLLVCGLDIDLYRGVETVLVYPSTFVTRALMLNSTPGEGGRRGGRALGLAWARGPVVLAWDAVLAGGRDPEDGENVVVHEFAHKLDMLDGDGDGMPILASHAAMSEWFWVFDRAYNELVDKVDFGRSTFLGDYAATNKAEFFAVASERFFEQPRQLRERHAEVYGLLRRYYGQDPAGPG